MAAADLRIMRGRMVQEQLIPRGICDKSVLDAFKKVERHKFIPDEFLDAAYADNPLPIGEGQTISQPYMAALMTEALELTGKEKILEVGTGSGYQTAILAELAKEVYSVERLKGVSETASKDLGEAGYPGIKMKVGDGTLGWKEHAPYDGILVTAGSPEIPKSLLAQLKEGGNLVIPVGNRFSQTLVVVKKTGDQVSQRNLSTCVFVPLIGKEGWEEEDAG